MKLQLSFPVLEKAAIGSRTADYSAWAHNFHNILKSTMQYLGSRGGRDHSDV